MNWMRRPHSLFAGSWQGGGSANIDKTRLVALCPHTSHEARHLRRLKHRHKEMTDDCEKNFIN